MKKKTILFTSCLLFFISIASAQPDHKDRKPPTPSMIIQKFDQNEDGKLSKKESEDARFYRAFDEIDSDSDSYLTKEELTVFFENRKKGRK